MSHCGKNVEDCISCACFTSLCAEEKAKYIEPHEDKKYMHLQNTTIQEVKAIEYLKENLSSFGIKIFWTRNRFCPVDGFINSKDKRVLFDLTCIDGVDIERFGKQSRVLNANVGEKDCTTYKIYEDLYDKDSASRNVDNILYLARDSAGKYWGVLHDTFKEKHFHQIRQGKNAKVLEAIYYEPVIGLLKRYFGV